jgi:hypothetical protein
MRKNLISSNHELPIVITYPSYHAQITYPNYQFMCNPTLNVSVDQTKSPGRLQCFSRSIHIQPRKYDIAS